MDFGCKPMEVDLNKHLNLACKSKDDAMTLMREYREYLTKKRKENSDKKIEDETKKKEEDLKKLTSKENIFVI
jgi:acetyl-CoA carboxylase carboxyltransferase component